MQYSVGNIKLTNTVGVLLLPGFVLCQDEGHSLQVIFVPILLKITASDVCEETISNTRL